MEAVKTKNTEEDSFTVLLDCY